MLMYRETEQHIKDKVNTMFYKAPWNYRKNMLLNYFLNVQLIFYKGPKIDMK